MPPQRCIILISARGNTAFCGPPWSIEIALNSWICAAPSLSSSEGWDCDKPGVVTAMLVDGGTSLQEAGGGGGTSMFDSALSEEMEGAFHCLHITRKHSVHCRFVSFFPTAHRTVLLGCRTKRCRVNREAGPTITLSIDDAALPVALRLASPQRAFTTLLRPVKGRCLTGDTLEELFCIECLHR